MTSDRNETAGFDGHAGLQNESGTLSARVEARIKVLEASEPTCSHNRCGHVACVMAAELRVLLAEPAAEDEAVARAIRTLLPGLRVANYVERWSPSSPAVQALSALSEYVGEGPVIAGDEVDPDVPSAHHRRPAGDPVPAPAADGGEVEALVRRVAKIMHRFDCEWCDECSGPNFNQQRLAREIVDSLADLRRTERAEGAREAAERAWDEGWQQGTGDAWQNGGHESKPNPYRAASGAGQ